MIPRFALTALAALAGLGVAAAFAQGSATDFGGSISGSNAAGGSYSLSYTCSGEPVCTGVYHATRQYDGCSNGIQIQGALRITGLDLSRTGLITPVATLTGFSIEPVRNGSTCTLGPRSDEVITLVGNWGGSGGSVSVQRVETDRFGRSTLATLGGSMSASRPAPPLPVFSMGVSGSIGLAAATVQGAIQFRAQDQGTNPRVYVFAIAPANRIGRTLMAADALVLGSAKAEGKADPVPCVLAQLDGSGQLVGVSTSQLVPATGATVTSQGATVTLLNNVTASLVAGATFFVGYGGTAEAMLANGLNRSVATVPGQPVCQPQPPATGWWWNPQEDGRGYSVEVRDNNIFFAAFLYDASGRSTWHVATGPASMAGAYYTGPLYAAKGGQTLGGPYPGGPALSEVGTIVLAFNSDTQGTMVWPGGVVPLRRFDIVAGGSEDPGVFGHPENGWWWNPAESGRGFFMEWQKGTLDLAGYMYDDQGNSVWYLAWGQMLSAGSFTFNGTWWSYGNGQTLTGAWKPNQRVNANVAPVSIIFSSPTAAVMTLPNGRTTTLQRHRF